MTVKVIGLDQLNRKLSKLSSGVDLRAAMREVSLYMLQENTVRFSEQKAPDGTPWLQSKRAIKQNGQTLVDTGRLRQSVLASSNANSARVGTNLIYAKTHQEGRKKIPARPFIGLASDELAQVIRILERHIGRSLL